jgi:hypothetical protein
MLCCIIACLMESKEGGKMYEEVQRRADEK